MQNAKEIIRSGQAVLGIEFGSTRIKAVLIDKAGAILATGGFDWENDFDNGIWTYSQEKIWCGLQTAYQALVQNVQNRYQTTLTHLSAIGISAMMHGYLPFDRNDELLTPFRTWRNNITQQAAEQLSDLFDYNIPQRWSIAHLYQAILNQEAHLKDITYLTTLSGYIHWQLTGEKVLGIGDASGMFPIDVETLDYDQKLLTQFAQQIEPYQYPWSIKTLLPQVLPAGEFAGRLTMRGARLLDPQGNLQAGIPFCPPEGDAGTGMVATNSIKEKTGNISAGTSAFAMIVLEKALSKRYEALDMVTTPAGKLVAMAHANNCTSDINAWVSLLQENLRLFGLSVTTEQLYERLFEHALSGRADAGGLLSYGFYSGEHNVSLAEGCPLFIHPTKADFNLANFMLVHIYSAFAAMKLGMDILLQEEKVCIEQIFGHGGIFKTQGIAQKVLACALGIPVATMTTAGEGGAWGMALLANFLGKQKCGSLEQYLQEKIFCNTAMQLIEPDEEMHNGYEAFMQRYKQGLSVVHTAVTKVN